MNGLRISGSAALVAAAACFLNSALAAPNAMTRKYFVYVGTYTGPASKGIYTLSFDSASGKLESMGLGAEIANPAFLTTDGDHRFLYAVTEDEESPHDGSVSGFAIDRKTGKLTPLNRVSSRGTITCHLTVDKSGKMLLVANYGNGRVSAFPIHGDGRLSEASAVIEHHGSSIDKKRQEGPHAHGVTLSQDNRFVFVPDLGLDKIFSYKIDPGKGTITPNDPPFATVTPGAGPRHLTFRPDYKFAYVIDEMGSMVSAFRYDATRGALTRIQEISSLTPGFKGQNDSAEIHTNPAGTYLYASNRGDDSIAVFAIDRDHGTLTSVQHVPTQGKTPRNFEIDPTGQYLFAANQDSNNIVVFRIDQKTGHLSQTGTVLKVPSPVSMGFVPAL